MVCEYHSNWREKQMICFPPFVQAEVRNNLQYTGICIEKFHCVIAITNIIRLLCSHFHQNLGSRGSGDTTAVTVYRVLLAFYGNNSFYDNFGGGTSLLSSRMDVRGRVLIDRNTAVFGAGVAMSGRSLVRNSSAYDTFMWAIPP